MNKTYSQAIRNVAWAYIFLCFNLNIGTVDILPDWWGYCLIASALPVIINKEPSAVLLKNFVTAMVVIEVIEWIVKGLGAVMNYYIFSIFVSVIYIYTHFQLLTNIADIADRENSVHGLAIRGLRSWVIIGVTATNIIMSFLPNLWLIYGIAIVNLLVFIILSAQLFSYAKDETGEE